MEQELIVRRQSWSSYEALLESYVELLIQANKKTRLTGPQDAETLWKEHVLDCLHLLELLPEKGTVVDVGTGGGLPGMVLALCRPDLNFTLVDSVHRKCEALHSIATHMKLSHVTVLCRRSEELAQQFREHWNVAVVRAVSEAPVVAEYLSPLVAPGGALLAMKGPAWIDEIAPAQGKWGRLGLSEPKGWFYSLEEKERWIIQWSKMLPCPEKFPRRPGRAEKVFWWR